MSSVSRSSLRLLKMGFVYLEEACIRYVEGDLMGELLAYCSLGHIFVVIVYITLVVVNRDIQVKVSQF